MTSDARLPVLDRNALLEQAGGDPSLVSELVTLFADDRETVLPAMREAIGRGDPDALARIAHRLKGSLAALHALAAHAATRELEALARAAELGRASVACDALERELERLDPELARAAQ